MNMPEPIPFKTEGPQPLLRETPQGANYPAHALRPPRDAVESAQGMTLAPFVIPAQSALAVASLAVHGHADAETLRGTAPPDTAEELAEAIQNDILAAHHGPVEAEAERMRRRWMNHCRDQRRRPAITAAEKRRAAAISFDDSPRATLAAAWAGATDRDRRDLIERVTGSISHGL